MSMQDEFQQDSAPAIETNRNFPHQIKSKLDTQFTYISGKHNYSVVNKRENKTKN